MFGIPITFIIFFVGLSFLSTAVPLAIKAGRGLKGRIILSVEDVPFRGGRDITGAFALSAKRPLGPGRLTISLICIEEWFEWERRRNGGRRKRKRQRELYRNDIEMAPQLSVAGGQRQVIQFSLPTPQPQDTISSSSGSPDSAFHGVNDHRANHSGESATPGWERALRSIAKGYSPKTTILWEVAARYDISGLDLAADQRIQLHHSLEPRAGHRR